MKADEPEKKSTKEYENVSKSRIICGIQQFDRKWAEFIVLCSCY